MINVSDLKPGVTFQMDGNLFVVLDYSHNKTARAAANVKVKMKNLRTGSTTEMTFGGRYFSDRRCGMGPGEEGVADRISEQ